MGEDTAEYVQWYYGPLEAEDVEKLRRSDKPMWIVWRHLDPSDQDSFEVAAVTGDGPLSEQHARWIAEHLPTDTGSFEVPDV